MIDPQDQTIKVVTSRKNPFIDSLRQLRDNPSGDLIFLEGPKLLEEALKSNLTIEQLVFTPEILDTDLIKMASAMARTNTQVTSYVLEGLSDVETPQGVVAIARKPIGTWAQVLSRMPKPLVILDGIQNAGNASAIIRTAEAAGVGGVVTTPQSARLFSPKALRGAMGSSLRVPILEHQIVTKIAEQCTAAGYGILATASPSKDSVPYTAVDWTRAWAIVLGQEGNGLSAAWGDCAPTAVHIPMEPSVESLNVAAAAAILCYEARRQRI